MPSEDAQRGEPDLSQLTETVTRALLAGAAPAKIVRQMVAAGIPEQQAQDFVAQVQEAVTRFRASPAGQQATRAAMLRRFRGQVWMGLIWLAAAVAMAAIKRYSWPAHSTAIIVLSIVALFGVGQLVLGIRGMRKLR